MAYFSIIMFIVTASFGVVRQAVHFQNEEWSWFMVRSVFFYPYWMIYGEIFKEEIDSQLLFSYAYLFPVKNLSNELFICSMRVFSLKKDSLNSIEVLNQNWTKFCFTTYVTIPSIATSQLLEDVFQPLPKMPREVAIDDKL